MRTQDIVMIVIVILVTITLNCLLLTVKVARFENGFSQILHSDVIT